MNSLASLQKKIKLQLIDFDLPSLWNKHEFINTLRERAKNFFPVGLYDPQDLEHQVLFRLTTYQPDSIDDQVIEDTVREQYTLMQHRLQRVAGRFDLAYLFRGLSGKFHDLNCNKRLLIENRKGILFACDNDYSFKVEFRPIIDEQVINLFCDDLHYIHHAKNKGEAFGLYFTGDDLPWAVETTEYSTFGKEYKREALLAHGIDPNKAVELTRLYTLPGSPRNAVSIIDSMVMDHYKQRGFEAVFSTTMPMYSKTKGTTIASNMGEILLVKKLCHYFVPITIGKEICYKHVTRTFIAEQCRNDFIQSHPDFPVMLTVEVFRRLQQGVLQPLPVLKENKKVIYIADRAHSSKNLKRKTEIETKFFIENVMELLRKLRDIATYVRTEYLRDIIYNFEEKRIRLRVCDLFDKREINAIYKYRIAGQDGLKTEIEETVYEGEDIEEALSAIRQHGNFEKANSYEKIRIIYKEIGEAELTLDIYPYGAWLEIESAKEKIWEIASRLGFKKEDSIVQNADELYDAWCRRNDLDILWDVRFGVHNADGRIYEKADKRTIGTSEKSIRSETTE